MSYTADSPIMGKGTVSAQAIDAFIALVGKERAAESAPDGKYRAPEAGLGIRIINAAQTWPGHEVNYELVASQFIHESAGAQSFWWRDHHNPAGIGVDGTPGKGEHFDTALEGFVAQTAHLLDYAAGKGAWTPTDRRAKDMPSASFGIAPTLHGLDARWATPGLGYGAAIAALGNRLVDFANNGNWGSPMAVPKPPMTIMHSPRFDGYGHAREYRAFVDHIATGSKSSNLSWLAGGSADAKQPSVNYYIAKDGTIYEIVPYQHAPWTNGWDTSVNIMATYRPNVANAVVKYWADNKINPNTGSVTTEHEGEASDRLTAAQIASGAWLKAWLHQETGIPLDREHWFGHSFIDSVNRPYCPSFDPDEWAALLAGALARVNAQPLPPAPPLPKPPAAPTLVLPGQPNGYGFVAGFRAHLLKIGAAVNPQDPALGALAVFGYALSDEYTADNGHAYQPCERYVLEYQPGVGAPWDVVGVFRGTEPPLERKSQ